jgi:putative ABC transport system permease protein
MSITPISNFHLVLSTVLVIGAGLISALLRLGLLKSLLWGTVRTFVQLLLVGYVLTYVFAVDHPALVAGMVLVMCLIAARASLQRLKEAPVRPFGLAVLALGTSTFLVGTIVCGVIIGGERWYAARLTIPIAGMILGNSLTGISLALDRMYGEIKARSGEVETRLSLGYTGWEAVRPHVRTALRAGMTPMINALMVVGIVALPGMMTGQILAGADPLTAVRYQIVVMLMIAAAVTLGSLIIVGLSFRRCFTDEEALRPDLR